VDCGVAFCCGSVFHKRALRSFSYNDNHLVVISPQPNGRRVIADGA